MSELYKSALAAALLFALLLFPLPASGQENDDYLKSLLTEYYTGKIVRAKVAIPASRKGLEIVDGFIRETPLPPGGFAAEPGDPLLIAQIRFKSKSIEVRFDGEENESAAPADPAGKNFTSRAKKGATPRILLQFTRAITTRDLNIRTINNLLGAAVDVSTLTPLEPARATTEAAEESRKRPDAAQIALMLAERRARAQGIPTAPIKAEGTVSESGVGELTIECALPQARLYIDGAFSGSLPRTIRILAGVHTILVICEGSAPWEKQFFIPAGHASIVRAELQSPPK
jgi:hypothetical protein